MIEEAVIPTNEYQTPITRELLEMYPDEIQEWFLDAVNNIPFVKSLISPDRRYARDLERDEKGRVIVDIENPHICENMDYFRPAALFFEKHGCYTLMKPNSNPQSEYRKFWAEELRRCREGYVRESDGEWVTGYCYWFLNYTPMMVNKITKGSKRANRQEGFPFFFEGIYWRFHYLQQARDKGEHAIELAKRGCGKSYSLSSIMSHNLILGESSESNKRIITVLAAYQKEYLKDDKDGTFSKFIPSISFLASNTPFPRLMLKNSPNEMSWQMGYLDKDGTRKGSFNTVMGVSIKEDVGKLRGKRGIILFEEMGNMPGLLTVYDTCRRSVEDGDYSFGQMYLVGTASEKESDFSSAKTLLYQTSGYHLKTLDNVFDRVGSGKNTFGFFFPAYINRAGCYNKDGVSDVVKALLEIFKARYVAKYGTDPQSVLRVIAEDPITPAEAIIKVKAAYFPVADINEQLNFIDSHPRFFDDTYVGELVFNSDKRSVRFSPNADTPIREFGVRNDTPGAIEIYQMPVKNSTGVVPYGRYIVGHDPVDNDQADSSSLSSTFVFDLFTDEIVAEFTGRRAFAEDNWEICRRLCIFYNARCLYESNRKGLFAYFQKYNSLNYLADTPQYLRDKGLVKYNAFGNNTKGVNASAAINGYANSLLREWLKKTKTVIMKDEKGEEYEAQQMNVFTIKSKAFLQECAAFTPEINVDRIRAMGMVMLLREETQILYQGEVGRMELEKQKDYAGDDPFFSDNYDDRYGNSKFSNFDFE